MANTGSWIDVRPSADLARRYRELGFWREVTPAADLWRWAWETPDAVAITAHRVGSGIQRMTYREYADQVDRVTTVLGELGIGPGNVVTAQLPNWWQLNAVVLACARLGAIVAPVVTTVRGPELELQMARLKPVAYVTTETWDGYPHSAVLASIADRLPSVQHRVIVGGRVAPGEIDFERRVEEADAAGPGTDCPAEDPDRISVVLFTSGTTGTPKAVLHSFNTFYAPCRSVALGNGLSSADVLYTPHALGHVLAQHVANMLPLYLGAQAVFADTWDPERAVRLLARYGVTYAVGAPVYLEAIARATRRQDQRPPRLRRVCATATTIPAGLVGTVSDDLGVTLQNALGMTELGPASMTSPGQDPPDWAAHSVGRPFECVEVDLRSGGEVSAHDPARLFVCGPSTCLATMPRDGGQLNVLAENDDSWYETGDLAIPDGRGGLRLIGRPRTVPAES
jgi:cyclohexanecarboxylate-CoA ligase